MTIERVDVQACTPARSDAATSRCFMELFFPASPSSRCWPNLLVPYFLFAQSLWGQDRKRTRREVSGGQRVAWRAGEGDTRTAISPNLECRHSIRINRQWRLIFQWDGARGEASDVYLDDHSYR
jgi:hypothetical protein